jgi:hypothetical protein
LGDWVWGFGDWVLAQTPNPQSPIPNPQSPMKKKILINFFIYFNIKLLIIKINFINNKLNNLLK